MTPENQDDSLEVRDLDRFVKILVAWHALRVQVLEHMDSIPEGTMMVMDDGSETELKGDLLRGLRVGIQIALMELGKLPFTYTTEPDTADEQAA